MINREVLEFFIETSEKEQRELVHGLDFASMGFGSKNDLAREVYYRTKKDVVEYKRKKPYQALMNKNVMKFMVLHSTIVSRWYNGKMEIFNRYLAICNGSVN